MARSNAVGKLREIVDEEGDPKEVLLRSLGSAVRTDSVTRGQVLVATHPGAKYHAGTKILRTDTDLLEQRFQGSVGLVVKMGPLAFVDAPGASFGGVRAKVSDWVLTRPADGLELFINQVPCRLFEDVNILMVVSNPDSYW